MARALRPAMSVKEWYHFKAEESRAIADELSDLDCKMKMLRNAATWDMLSKGSGIPSFFAVPRNKRIKSAENFSEKNRKEPIKWPLACSVWEKVEYRLDE
jgi:hypothetical protein